MAIKMLLAAGLGLAATMFASPALAQQEAPEVADACKTAVAVRDLDTNRAMLDALLKRREEVFQGEVTDKNRDALGFLDSQIVKIRARIAVCAPGG